MQGLRPSMHLYPFPPETDLAHSGVEPRLKLAQMQTNHKSINYPADPSSSVVLDEVQYKRETVEIHIAMPG